MDVRFQELLRAIYALDGVKIPFNIIKRLVQPLQVWLEEGTCVHGYVGDDGRLNCIDRIVASEEMLCNYWSSFPGETWCASKGQRECGSFEKRESPVPLPEPKETLVIPDQRDEVRVLFDIFIEGAQANKRDIVKRATKTWTDYKRQKTLEAEGSVQCEVPHCHRAFTGGRKDGKRVCADHWKWDFQKDGE